MVPCCVSTPTLLHSTPPPPSPLSLPAENAQKIGSPLFTWSELRDGKVQEIAKTAGEWANAIVNNPENGIGKQWDIFTNKLKTDFDRIFNRK